MEEQCQQEHGSGRTTAESLTSLVRRARFNEGTSWVLVAERSTNSFIFLEGIDHIFKFCGNHELQLVASGSAEDVYHVAWHMAKDLLSVIRSVPIYRLFGSEVRLCPYTEVPRYVELLSERLKQSELASPYTEVPLYVEPLSEHLKQVLSAPIEAFWKAADDSSYVRPLYSMKTLYESQQLRQLNRPLFSCAGNLQAEGRCRQPNTPSDTDVSSGTGGHSLPKFAAWWHAFTAEMEMDLVRRGWLDAIAMDAQRRHTELLSLFGSDLEPEGGGGAAPAQQTSINVEFLRNSLSEVAEVLPLFMTTRSSGGRGRNGGLVVHPDLIEFLVRRLRRDYDLETGAGPSEEEVAKMLKDLLCQALAAFLPACATAYPVLKDAPNHVKLIISGGLLIIFIVLFSGMLSTTLARRRLAFRLVSCSVVTLFTFSVASQLSGPTYIAITALVGVLLNLFIMLLQF